MRLFALLLLLLAPAPSAAASRQRLPPPRQASVLPQAPAQDAKGSQEAAAAAAPQAAEPAAEALQALQLRLSAADAQARPQDDTEIGASAAAHAFDGGNWPAPSADDPAAIARAHAVFAMIPQAARIMEDGHILPAPKTSTYKLALRGMLMAAGRRSDAHAGRLHQAVGQLRFGPSAFGVRLSRSAEGAIVVHDVKHGGMAESAGIIAGDELLRVGDQPLRGLDAGQINAFMGEVYAGERPLVVRREGITFEVKVPSERRVVSAFFMAVAQRLGAPVERLARAAAKHSTAALDRFTWIMPPEISRQAHRQMSGAYAGIGVQLRFREGGVVEIVGVTKGGPADRAGLRRGDRLELVHGAKATAEAVAKMTTGKPGQRVPLRLSRGTRVWDAELVTEQVAHRAVAWRLEQGGAGYIVLREFTKGSAAEMAEAVADLEKRGAKRLVLDLRFNSGGFTNEASAILSLFLKTGAVAFIEQTRFGKVPHPVPFAGRAPSALRLDVLVGPNSISSSEIVAAALQDHGRAKLWGQPTWGKGYTQGWVPLEGGGTLSATSARWLTPKGRHIQPGPKGAKLQPDVPVPMDEAQFAKAAKRAGALFTDEAVPRRRDDLVLSAVLKD